MNTRSVIALTLLVTLSYQAQMLRLTVDDDFDETAMIYTGLCCNTEASGGGMKLAPGARFDDDLVLHVEPGVAVVGEAVRFG